MRRTARPHAIAIVMLCGAVAAGCNIASPPQPEIPDKTGLSAAHWVAEVGYALREGIWMVEILDPDVVLPDVEARSGDALGAVGSEAVAQLTLTALAGVRLQVLATDPSVAALQVPGVTGEQLQTALRPRFEGREGGIEPSTVEHLAVGDWTVEVYHYPAIHRILALVAAGDTLYTVSDRTDAGWQRGVLALPGPTPSPGMTLPPRPWVWVPPRP
jgi:hypothetical protein